MQEVIIKGRSASKGTAEGKVRIILDGKFDLVKEGEVLVTTMTTPDVVPVLDRVKAIVTDQGGRLCHAAIIAREYGIPTVVGTGNATKLLRTGQRVRVDATAGEVHPA